MNWSFTSLYTWVDAFGTSVPVGIHIEGSEPSRSPSVSTCPSKNPALNRNESADPPAALLPWRNPKSRASRAGAVPLLFGADLRSHDAEKLLHAPTSLYAPP